MRYWVTREGEQVPSGGPTFSQSYLRDRASWARSLRVLPPQLEFFKDSKHISLQIALVIPQSTQELVLQTQRSRGDWHFERQYQAQQQALLGTTGWDIASLYQYRKGRDLGSVPSCLKWEHLRVQTQKIRLLRPARPNKMLRSEDQNPSILTQQKSLLLLEVHKQINLPLQIRQHLPSAQNSHHLQHP